MTSLPSIALLCLTGASFVVSQTHVVEVYFVVEPQVTANYMKFYNSEATAISNINTDIAYLVHEVNELYKSLGNHGLSIEVRAKKVQILSAAEKMYGANLIQSDRLLEKEVSINTFSQWLKDQGAHSKVGYDLAILFTGYNLFTAGLNDKTAGYAQISSACREDGAGVVEFSGPQASVLVTAHEMGHILGSIHDPDDASSPCSNDLGFVMTSSASAFNKNRWSFSSCSAEHMKKYINAISCLSASQTTTPASTFKLSDIANADVLNPEKQCQRYRIDANAYFSRFLKFYKNTTKGDEYCKVLYCGIKGSGLSLSKIPSEGMACDTDKRCFKGKCEYSSVPTGISDPACIFGDIQSNFVGWIAGSTCTSYMSSYLSSCYYYQPYNQCCNTCKQKRLDIPNCEYGDKSTQCQGLSTSICSDESSRNLCCKLCHNYQGKRSNLLSPSLDEKAVSDDPLIDPIGDGSEFLEKIDEIIKID